MRYLLVILSCFYSFNALSIEVMMDYNAFYAPEIGTYLETNISIPDYSLVFNKQENGNYQANIEVTIIIKDKDKVIAFDKYTLNNESFEHPDSINFSIIDKKRFPLKQGLYTIESSFKDLNSDAPVVTEIESYIVSFDLRMVQISDIEFVDSYKEATDQTVFTKAGVNITPFVMNFFSPDVDVLSFYAELYLPQTLINESFVATYSIRQYNTDNIVAKYNGFKKVAKTTVTPILQQFNISDLASGNYELVIEVKNKENVLVAIKKEFFQRFKELDDSDALAINDIKTEEIDLSFVAEFSLEELKYQLLAVSPIAGHNEQVLAKRLRKSGDIQLMKRFYYTFWKNYAPENPYRAWQAYQEELQKVNESFTTTLLHGFESDRGRVYLQYGSPNQIQDSKMEPNVYPYEIWHFYSTNMGQNNIHFVFIAEDRITNSYQLVHSTAINEVSNKDWRSRLTMPHGTGVNMPDENGNINNDRNFGNRVNQNYND